MRVAVTDVTMRKCAYAIKGKAPRDHRILSHGIRYYTIPIMSLEGVLDVCLIEGWKKL